MIYSKAAKKDVILHRLPTYEHCESCPGTTCDIFYNWDM